MSSDSHSVTKLIGDLHEGDAEAARALWERYFLKLVGLARNKLRGAPRRAFDEEDVAVDVFDSVCRGIQQGRYPRLDSRDDLWRLLFVTTMRKSLDRMKFEMRQRRGGGKVRGESAAPGSASSDGRGLEYFMDDEPTPELAAALAELYQRVMNQLDDEQLRKIAVLKLEGHTDEEIAQKLGCVRRTVVRKLKIIRGVWQEELEV